MEEEEAEGSSRAAQRERTRARILNAACWMFSERGYERTGIRDIAAEAKVDPKLVMHYFGSKKELFRAVAQLPGEAVSGSSEQVAESLLTFLEAKLRTEDVAALAMIRSMLTHPEAADGVRESMGRQQRQIAEVIPTSDAVLRASLVGAVTLGVVMSRYLLRLDGVSDATPEDIVALLRPCFTSLIPEGGEPAA